MDGIANWRDSIEASCWASCSSLEKWMDEYIGDDKI